MKQKIVIAEDSPDHARILHVILEKNNFDVIWLKNGQEALDYLRVNPAPDLLITDIMMPGISGFELLTHLKAENIMPTTLVISGCQREEDVLRGLEYGAEDYLSKPFSPKIVMAKVQNVLSKKGGALKQIASIALFTVLSLGMFHSESKADPVSFTVGGSRSWSEKYTGWLGTAQLGYQLSNDVQVKASTRNLRRDYGGVVQISEWGGAVGAVVKTSWGYVDTNLGYTPEPITFSRLLVGVEPHLLSGSDDFSLGLITQRYEVLKVYTIKPSWFREWNGWLRTAGALWLVNTPEWVASAQTTAVITFSEKHQIRIDGSWGRTVEDANSLVQFKNISGNYRFGFTPTFGLNVGFQRYTSDTRTENSALASLEWK